ncbi:MAG: hypothetical protein Q6J46_10555 [Thermostichus sp. DG02_2_bins_29]
MNILRQYVFPALLLLVFLFTLVVVSIRSFLPGDMAQPAPMEDLTPVALTPVLMSGHG